MHIQPLPLKLTRRQQDLVFLGLCCLLPLSLLVMVVVLVTRIRF